MGKQNITAWVFEGGSVSLPNRLLAFMEPLGMTFDDIGKMMYLLYCGVNDIKRTDRYAVEAATTLHKKGLIHWYVDAETVDFSPMYDKISASIGETAQYTAPGMTAEVQGTAMDYAQLIKRLEQETAVFLSLQDKQQIEEVVQRYCWSYELVYEIYMAYHRKHRRDYKFRFFCQMAYGANVQDKKSLEEYLSRLNTTVYRTTEVIRRLGSKSYPTEPQQEMYLKWTGIWKFTHEMVMRAVDESVGASHPSFKYLDRILEDWKDRGITTPEALEQEKEEEKTRSRQQREQAGSRKAKGGPAKKFQQEQRDLSVLEL